MSSIGEGSLTSGSDDTNRPTYGEQPRTSSTEHQKIMAEHSGKDILSSDVEIKGSIKFQKELLIDGKVEGEINSEGVLTIGENADIRGEIKTKSIIVFGKVHGNITVNETNTMPAFTPISIYPRAWAVTGVDYPTLLTTLVETALARGVGLR